MSILGTGTEIVECLRIAQMIERHGELFINRVYTPQEIEYCRARVAATQHYAGFWAGKESVLRALGTDWRRGITWRDIEIRMQPNGTPVVSLHGGARDILEAIGIKKMHLSVSHCRSHAVAMAIAEGYVDDDK